MHDWKRLVRARLGPLTVDGGREADIVDELAQHVAQQHRELVASGIGEAEALERALAPLTARAAREIARADRLRDAAPTPPPTAGSIAANMARDLRYGIRLLRRAPGFAAAAMVTLALGIGANAAIFSVVRAVVVRAAPYREPDRIAVFLNGRGVARGLIASSSLPDYEDWRRQLTSFESLGIASGWTFNISGLEFPERVWGMRVSGSLFPLLGTAPLLGRTIEPSDDRSSGDEVVVLGYRVWQRLFGGDPRVVGRTVMMEGRPHTVIGVMPPRFRFPTTDTEVWGAIKTNLVGMPRNSRFMVAVGRMKPGVRLSSAQAETDTVTARLERQYPDTNKGWRVELMRLQDATVGDVKPALILLAGAVGLVLLIGCANVSNLLFARAASRQRETAIRLALGSTRARLVAQWATENLVLSLAGAVCGIALAYAVVRLIVAFGPADVPRLDESEVDVTVLAVTFVISMAAAIVPALGPAIRALRVSSNSALTEGGATYSGSGHGRIGAWLIVGEVALTMTLAVAGTLLLKSFARLVSVPPGFDPDRVLSLKVFLQPPRYGSVASEKQYIHDALERMKSVTGVEAVAAASQLPIGDPSSGQRFDIEGRETAPADRPMVAYRAVSASYLPALRIPILRGRGLSDDDGERSPLVVVINEAAARKFWRDRDPIGQRIRWATGIAVFDKPVHTVVGVAADVKSTSLDKPELPAVYAPYTQRMFPWLRWNSFVVRTYGDPQLFARTIREELTKLDPQQPIFQVASLDTVIAQSVASRRFQTWLIDAFATLALALCAVGVYGTIGYWVADHSRDIGIRMALGATRRGIRLAVIARACGFAAVGVALGLGLCTVTGRLLSRMLFNVDPLDITTLATVTLVVLATAAAAAYVPARRASTLDPLIVIRHG